MWSPGHIGIRGNEAADRAAKKAIDTEPTDDFAPSSDLTPLTAKHLHQVWQKGWDQAVIVSYKLQEILPKLSDKLLSFCKTRKEDTVLNKLHTVVIRIRRIPFFWKKTRASCLRCM